MNVSLSGKITKIDPKMPIVYEHGQFLTFLVLSTHELRTVFNRPSLANFRKENNLPAKVWGVN